MKQLVRLRMRPSRDGKVFRYMLDYVDQDGRRRQISLGHADKRQAERRRHEKELELRVNVSGPVSMKLSDFFRDSLSRTKGQVRATSLGETKRSMEDFVDCIGDIDVQEVRYEHGERFNWRKTVVNSIGIPCANSGRPRWPSERSGYSQARNAMHCAQQPGNMKREAVRSNGSFSSGCAWPPVCGVAN
jgi:hypothetical protein